MAQCCVGGAVLPTPAAHSHLPACLPACADASVSHPLRLCEGGEDHGRLLFLRACAGMMAGKPDQTLIMSVAKVCCRIGGCCLAEGHGVLWARTAALLGRALPLAAQSLMVLAGAGWSSSWHTLPFPYLPLPRLARRQSAPSRSSASMRWMYRLPRTFCTAALRPAASSRSPACWVPRCSACGVSLGSSVPSSRRALLRSCGCCCRRGQTSSGMLGAAALSHAPPPPSTGSRQQQRAMPLGCTPLTLQPPKQLCALPCPALPCPALPCPALPLFRCRSARVGAPCLTGRAGQIPHPGPAPPAGLLLG